jgi:4-hydroxy-3-polyprenylbenzoate decarboxylase
LRDLRDFLKILEERSELARIPLSVSPELEISEITQRVSKGPKDLNKALLFENVKESNIPVVTNLFGTHKRMALALGVKDLKELEKKAQGLLGLFSAKTFGDFFRAGKEVLRSFWSFVPRPKLLKEAPCQEIIKKDAEVNLYELPFLKCWPKDKGPFITLPQVVTLDPFTGQRNVGMYRLQVVDKRTLLVHWQRHKVGTQHQIKAKALGLKAIPCAVVLGGDPACIWAASAPFPPGFDEYLFVNWLRGKPLEMVRCVSVGLEVPARAEIVIEGFIDLEDLREEGPFGDHTGYYTPVELFPTLHVSAITMRADPIYPATIVGIPPMEDYWLGKATERFFLPFIRLVLPEIVDIHMPAEGVFHNLLLVSIKKTYPGQARKVIFGLWGLGMMSLTKAIVVVDEEVELEDLSTVAWYVLGNVDWKRDVVIVEGPVDHLDHSAIQHSFGGKIGIDATRKLPEEGHQRQWPEKVKMSEEIKKTIDEKWPQIFEALKKCGR